MTIRVDIRVPVGRPLPELTEFITRCEDAGLDGVGIHDHHHTGRDAYIAMAIAAQATHRLHLYPATSNSVTRHPMVLAALTQSLNEIAPGRILLTLAPGFLSVEKSGSHRASRDQLRAVTGTVRDLLAGRSATQGGREIRLTHVPPTPPKVLLFASGPKLLELAGEVADGAAMLVGLHPDSIATARGHLHAGARRAGRKPAELEEIFIVPTAVAEPGEATTWPRRYFRADRPWLTYPSSTTLLWLRAAGIGLPDHPRPEDVTPDQAERICDALGLFGPAEQCADRLLRAHDEAAVDHVFLFPVHTEQTGYDLPEETVRAFAETIGPRLNG